MGGWGSLVRCWYAAQAPALAGTTETRGLALTRCAFQASMPTASEVIAQNTGYS